MSDGLSRFTERVSRLLLEMTPWERADIRVEEVLRPAIDRKIFGTLQHVKNHMQTPMNAAFKSGLRNALTGLYVY